MSSVGGRLGCWVGGLVLLVGSLGGRCRVVVLYVEVVCMGFEGGMVVVEVFIVGRVLWVVVGLVVIVVGLFVVGVGVWCCLFVEVKGFGFLVAFLVCFVVWGFRIMWGGLFVRGVGRVVFGFGLGLGLELGVGLGLEVGVGVFVVAGVGCKLDFGCFVFPAAAKRPRLLFGFSFCCLVVCWMVGWGGCVVWGCWEGLRGWLEGPVGLGSGFLVLVFVGGWGAGLMCWVVLRLVFGWVVGVV